MKPLERSMGEREAAARHKARTRNEAAANRILEAARRARGLREELRAAIPVDMDFPSRERQSKLTTPPNPLSVVQLRPGKGLPQDESFILERIIGFWERRSPRSDLGIRPAERQPTVPPFVPENALPTTSCGMRARDAGSVRQSCNLSRAIRLRCRQEYLTRRMA